MPPARQRRQPPATLAARAPAAWGHLTCPARSPSAQDWATAVARSRPRPALAPARAVPLRAPPPPARQVGLWPGSCASVGAGAWQPGVSGVAPRRRPPHRVRPASPSRLRPAPIEPVLGARAAPAWATARVTAQAPAPPADRAPRRAASPRGSRSQASQVRCRRRSDPAAARAPAARPPPRGSAAGGRWPRSGAPAAFQAQVRAPRWHRPSTTARARAVRAPRARARRAQRVLGDPKAPRQSRHRSAHGMRQLALAAMAQPWPLGANLSPQPVLRHHPACDLQAWILTEMARPPTGPAAAHLQPEGQPVSDITARPGSPGARRGRSGAASACR